MPRQSIHISLAVAVAALLAGCDSGQANVAVQTTATAFDSARSALNVAFGSVSEEAQKLTHRSGEVALTRARAAAIDLQAKLAELQAPSALDALRLEAVREQVARLDAAILVQGLRAKWDAALVLANNGKAMAQDQVARTRADLRAKDETFRQLDDRLIQAERAYTEASNRLGESLRALETAQRP